jgi:hypothetical protein
MSCFWCFTATDYFEGTHFVFIHIFILGVDCDYCKKFF